MEIVKALNNASRHAHAAKLKILSFKSFFKV